MKNKHKILFYLSIILFLITSCKNDTIIYSKHQRREYYYFIGSHKHYDTIPQINKNYIDSATVYYFKTNKGIEYINEINYYKYNNK